MEITLKASYAGYDIIFKSENVIVTEDIEERIYPVSEDGKVDYKSRPLRDISDNALNQFVALLDDIIYYRKRDFNSSDLIEKLFEKLPEDSANKLFAKLKNDYVFGDV